MEKVDFNRSYANKVSKEQFIEDHLHHGTKAELAAKYDELQDDKPIKKADKKES